MFYLKKTQTISDFTFKSMSTEILHSGLWVVLWLFVLRLIKYGELRFKRVTFKLQYYIKLGKNVSISVDSRIDFYNMLVFFYPFTKKQTEIQLLYCVLSIFFPALDAQQQLHSIRVCLNSSNDMFLQNRKSF